MNDQHITFSPERNQWTLTDGRHHMEVPEWAREIMRDEFERETRQLQAEADKLRELARGLVYATHPADRARLIAEAAELVGELRVEVDDVLRTE